MYELPQEKRHTSLLTSQARLLQQEVAKEAEDEESDQEQISSAQYIPHRGKSTRTAAALPLSTSATQDEEREVLASSPVLQDCVHPPMKDSIEGGVDVPQSNVEIALLSEDESQVLHGEIPLSDNRHSNVIPAVQPSESEYDTESSTYSHKQECPAKSSFAELPCARSSISTASARCCRVETLQPSGGRSQHCLQLLSSSCLQTTEQ